jgi:WD40 repeat protein/serine/threonine protein kinase/cytochrome c-type biogenesis protein CcmH/NrfG
MSDISSDPDPLLALAEEFAERYRRGERPPLTEYAERHPELAERIRRLFPTLAVMEEFGSVGGQATGPFEPAIATGPAQPQLGEYRILREVGRGGMGIVYEAVQESLGRHVALKVLMAHRLLSPTMLQRFEREAKAAARLHHTNIVPVYGVGESDGVHYFAMEFIHGQSVDAVLHELRRLRDVPKGGPAEEPKKCSEPAPSTLSGTGSPSWPGTSELTGRSDAEYFRSVARVGSQAAEALAHAHGQGVLHRDIKPANLLIDAQGAVWVTDFGLAKLEGSEDLTGEGEVPGTLRYMAPERFAGPADARSDLYSLGLTLYELLTLRPPFDAATRGEMIERILHAELPRPRALDPHLPRDLETIVLKCIAKEPERRYPSADALADDLRRFLAGEPVRARPVGLGERMWRWSKRNPALAGSIGAAVLATLTALTIFAIGLVLVTGARDAISREADAKEKEAKEKGELAEQKGKLAEKMENLATEKATLAASETEERKKAQLQYARADFESSYAQLEQDHARGLLWLARSLRVAKENNAPEVEWSIRAHLAGWGRNVHPLRAILQHKGPVVVARFSPDAKMILTASWDHTAQRWDAETGQPLGEPLQHAGPVKDAAFSADGKIIITASADGTARLWDARTGKALGKPLVPPVFSSPRVAASLTGIGSPWRTAATLSVALSAPRRPLVAAAIMPDGMTALAGREDGMVWRWEVSSGKQVGSPLAHPERLTRFALSPNGIILLTGGRNLTTVWAAGNGTMMGRLEGGPAPLVFSPSGMKFLTHAQKFGEFATAQIWDASQGIRGIGRPLDHDWEVNAAAFSRNELTLVTGSNDGLARLWDAETGRLLGQPMMHTSAVTAVDRGMRGGFPLQERALTGCADGTARLWTTGTATLLGPPLRHQASITAVAFGPGLKTMLTASLDGTARLWENRGGSAPSALLLSPDFHAPNTLGPIAAFSPDGKAVVLARADRTEVSVCDVATGAKRSVMLKHPGQAFALAFSPNSKLVLTGGTDRTARLWEAGTGKAVGEPMKQSVPVLAAAWSADGRIIATGGYDIARTKNEVQLWEAVSQKPRGKPLAAGWVKALAFSPDGTTLVTGDVHGFVRRWDLATRQERGELSRHLGPIMCLAFSPDGTKFLTGSMDLTARVWDAKTGKPIGLPMAHEQPVTGAAFNLDGKIVLTGSVDRGARLWDAATGKLLGPAMRPGGAILAVAFDGNSVLTWTEGAFVAVAERRHEVQLTVAGGPERIELWAQVLTGMELDEGGFARALDADTWQQRRQRLAELGGPPDESQPQPRVSAPQTPESADALEARATALAQQGKVEDAVAAYRKAAQLSTDKAQAARLHVNLGSLVATTRRLAEAEESFRKAVELQPNLVEAHFSLALCLGQQGKTKDAIATFRKAITVKPDYAPAWGNLGFALHKDGQYAEALKALREALRLLPQADPARPKLEALLRDCERLAEPNNGALKRTEP